MHVNKTHFHTSTLRVISFVSYQKLVMSLEHGRFSKRPSIKDHSPSMTLDVAFDKRSSLSHDIAKTFHGLPSMTIQKRPTLVPSHPMMGLLTKSMVR